MQQLIEFIPVTLFVAIYFYTDDIYLATAVLMAGVCVQVAFEFTRQRAVSKRTQFIFWVVMLAGGATLFFQDELFIKWKPTILNWMFCVALVVTQRLGQESLLKKMLGGQLTLPDKVWKTLNQGWALGFFIAGALNLIVAYSFSTDFWVAYKLIGGMALTLFYILITITYLVKGGHLKEQLQETHSDQD